MNNMKKAKNKKERLQDQQTIVLEDINSKVSLVLERFSGLDRKIDDNHQEFLEFRDETKENFSKLFEFRNEMTDFRRETKADLKVALEYLSRIDDEIQDIKSELADIKPRLKEKADLDRMLDMEKRIVKIEKFIFAKA